MGVLHLLIKILIVIVVILVVLFIGLILVPMKYNVLSKYDTSLKFEGEINFLYIFKISYSIKTKCIEVYLLKFRLFRFNKKADTSKINKNIKKDKLNKKKKLFSKSTLDNNLYKIKELISTIKPNEINIFGEYGMDDPGITGILSGLTYALKGAGIPINIDLNPIFTHEVLDVNIEVKGQVKAINIFKLLLK